MTLNDFTLFLPVLVLAAGIIVVMLVSAFFRRHTLTAGLTAAAIVLAGLAIPVAWPAAPGQITPLIRVDRFGLMYLGLLFLAGLVVVLLAHPYLQKQAEQPEEFYLLLLLALLGGSILVLSSHFASLVLGLEILSVGLYTMIGYLRSQEHSIEAALKYLVLAAVSAAIMLFGIALIYADRGSLTFSALSPIATASSSSHNVLLFTGLSLLFTGIGFKLAIVPFHMWTPDVYQGAPAPVSGFIATVSKGAIVVLLLRLAQALQLQQQASFLLALTIIAILSMLVGNLLALLQKNVKRILAYSSIAHLGYILVAIIASTQLGIVAVTIYLAAYFATILAAFGIVSVLSDGSGEAEAIEDYRSLFWKRPWLALVMTLALLSLIGMPLTAGFIGKFYLLASGVGSTLWLLVIVLVISSSIGLYYYLRVIAAMYAPLAAGQKSDQPDRAIRTVRLPNAVVLVFAWLVLVVLWIGLYPAPLIGFIQIAIGSL